MQYKHSKHDHLIFYDSWVTRDLAGIPFANSRPFVLHQYSLARLQAGLPFPVSCCWNGMAVLNGTFFQRGYQFRCLSCTSNVSIHEADSVPGQLLALKTLYWPDALSERDKRTSTSEPVMCTMQNILL